MLCWVLFERQSSLLVKEGRFGYGLERGLGRDVGGNNKIECVVRKMGFRMREAIFMHFVNFGEGEIEKASSTNC